MSTKDIASVSPEVAALRPDYVAGIIRVDGLLPGPSDEASEGLLTRAERYARELASTTAIEEIPTVAAWREAFRAFGAKPQRTRPSVETLIRLAQESLPRVDRLTDTYNAISVLHLLPIGGEDWSAYQGAARLVRATGDEPFDTVSGGEPITENPAAGEVVWRDDVGVTCRRWNWRQCQRTRLTGQTTQALFILDGLGITGVDGVKSAASALTEALISTSPDAHVESFLVGPAVDSEQTTRM